MEKSPGSNSSSSMNYNTDSSIGSEESGWTSYFEEAFSDINGGQRSSFSFCSSSLVSDAASSAASSAAWRFSSTHNFELPSPSTGDDLNLPKKLTFNNKAKPRKIFYDDSLEDTASSPVSSPKVGDGRGFDGNHGKSLYDHTSSSLTEGRSSEKCSERRADERTLMRYDGKDDSAGLKKRGLCLVPLSMLVNYLG